MTTPRVAIIDGFTIEGGPDSFLSSKLWAWQLCDELGLRDRMIGTNDTQRNVYILKGGKLHPYPKGMRLIVPVEAEGLLASELLSEEGKRRMLAEVEMQPMTYWRKSTDAPDIFSTSVTPFCPERRSIPCAAWSIMSTKRRTTN